MRTGMTESDFTLLVDGVRPMTAGTKIFLAIVAVLVAVLVVYYGILMRDESPTVVMDEPEEPVVAVREVPRPPMAMPRTEPREDQPRILGTPRVEPQPALEPEPEPREGLDAQPAEEPDDSAPLEDHSPVTVAEHPIGDGGKDAPDQPRAESEQDEVEAAREDALEQQGEEDERARELEREREREQESEQARRAVTEPPQYTEYTVRSGDTMSSIAAEWFGEAGKWDLIAKANPFVDPNRLTVGQVLRLPPKDTEREEIEGRAGVTATVYMVRSGDNLSRIARAYYNDPGLWRLIYDANRATIGNDPGRLRVGMRLTIPPAPKPAEDDNDDEDS
jgi:nucleoid-associated protein YgaU